MSWRIRCLTAASACLIALFALAPAYAAYEDESDPPVRVARLSVASGEVSFQPGGEDEWVGAVLNRPLIRGDRLWADRDSRAELQIGSTSVRIGETTSFQILALDDRFAQFEITEGVMNLRVRRLDRGQVYEVATPTLAFTVTEPGSFRIEVDSRGGSTQVIVWNGGGEATGEGSNFPLREGDAVRFYDRALRDYELLERPRYDDFDRFALERDERLERSASLRYVPDEVIGYDDLDEYGSWDSVPEYGNVWYPRRVAADWAPYRNGHWIWQDPWGWTWVDDAPWGFAPFHYGRWAYTGNRWGWIPGQRNVRPVYAPALVTFVGGSGWSVGISPGGLSIGWFPLGYREVYIPPYRASRNYFTQVNVSNTVINNNYITNVYNDNYVGGRALTGVNYVNRRARGGFTAVSSNTFVAATPVQQSIVQVNADAMNRAPITQVAAVAPSARSVMGTAAVARAKPAREIVDRRVVARTAPPPKPVPFAARQQELQRNPGKPLPPQTVQAMQQRERGGQQGRQQENVQVVTAGGTNTRSEAPRRGNRPDDRGRGNERQTGQPQGQVQQQAQGKPQPQGQAPQQERQGDTRARQQQELQRGQQEREARAQQDRQRQQQEREAQGQQQRQQQEREAQSQQQRQQQEREAREQQRQTEQKGREREQQDRQRQQQEREAQGQQQRQQQEREAQGQQQRQQQEREAQGQQQRQQQEREAREQQRQAEQKGREREQQDRQRQEREAQGQQQRQREQQEQQQQQQRQAEQQQRQAEQAKGREREQQERQRQQQEREAQGQQQRQREQQEQQQQQQRQAEQQKRQAEQQQRQREQQERQQQQQQQRQAPPQQQPQPPPQQQPTPQQQQQQRGKKPSKDKEKDKDDEKDDNG